MTKKTNTLIAAAAITTALGLAQSANAAFTVTLSAPTLIGTTGNEYFNVYALNDNSAATGSSLQTIDSTVNIFGPTGNVIFQLMDSDGDGAADVNYLGSGLTTTSAFSWQRVGGAGTFNAVAVSPGPTSTDPGGTGAQTQNINAAYTNNSVKTFNVAGFSPAGAIANTGTGAAFAHVVVPVGTLFNVSGTVIGTVGSGQTFVVSTPSNTSGGHSIIALTGTGTTPTNYGSQLTGPAGTATFAQGTNGTFVGGTNTAITVTKIGNGSYIPGYANVVAAAGSSQAYVQTNGFTPSTDNEEYALRLLVGGVAPTQAQIGQIIQDINSQTGTNVVASTIPTSFNSVFPASQFNILLTDTVGVGTSSFLGFDFSQETNVLGVSVAAIGAVPEPATLAGLLIGAGTLLSGRRRRSM